MFRCGIIFGLCLGPVVAAQATSFEDAVTLWHFHDAHDAAGADSVLEPTGKVRLKAPLEAEDREASIRRGGDGFVAEFGGSGCFVAGQGADGELNLPGDAMTLCVRLKDPSGKWDTSLFSKHGGHDALVYNFFTLDFGGAMSFGFELGLEGRPGMVQVKCPIAPTEADDWQDIVARYGGGKLQLFVNGILRDERAAQGALRTGNTEPCVVGGESTGGVPRRFFRGVMDHAALWNRALSDDEVTVLSGGVEEVAAYAARNEAKERERRANMPKEHAQLIEKANASVAEAAPKAAADPHRPIYHLATAANWINDPNGPIFFNGEYHMFFQHNPYGRQWGNMSWGHAVSKDLAHWEHRPIALTPNPNSYDSGGIFSGCCVIDDKGVPTILYTGVSPEVQCIATSSDGMNTWTKYEGNPVIPERPRDGLQGFRDPFAWREADAWYMVIGSGIDGEGGTALLYRSPDLRAWEYLHPLCVGFGKNWECPNFFPLGDKHVLVVSPHGQVRYSIGDYRDHKFAPGEWFPMDGSEGGPFYAPNCLEAPDGRRIMWGWVVSGGAEEYPWCGSLTLPRVLSLRPDGRLGVEPAEELALLRGANMHFENIALAEKAPNPLAEVQSDCFELLADIDPGNCDQVGFEVLCSPDGKEKAQIVYDNVALRMTVGAHGGDFQRLPGEKTVRLHVFVDKSLIEVFVNGRVAFTSWHRPPNSECRDINVFVRGPGAVVQSLDIWEMNTIW